MKSKFFKPTGIGNATVLISITSLASYVIGLLRDRIIAVNFGTTSATDAYNASFIIPDFLFNIFIAGALSAAFLPVFTDYLNKNKEEARKIANTVLTAGTILIGVISIIAFIFMHKITPILFGELNLEMQIKITSMTRMMLLASLLFTISNTLGNILMAYKHFFSYAISPVLYNLGIIFGVIFFSEKFGIYSAAIGVIIGGVFHCLIRIFDILSTEYKFTPQLKISHPGFKKIIKLMIPQSISLICVQLNLYIFSIVGMSIVAGGLAAFNFARNIKSFPVSLFGIAFATAVFPYLSSATSEKDKEKYTHHVQQTIQRILFFTIPAMFGIIFMATPIVDLILGGGIFKEKSIELTSILLLFFAISIPFESLTHILSRSFYAIQNTATPMVVNIIATIYIAVSTFLLAPKLGIEWLAINTSTAFAVQVLILAILLKKHLSGFKTKAFLISLLKTAIASGIMCVFIILSEQFELIIPNKLSHVLRILIGGAIFLFTASILKSPELSSVKYIINRLLKKSPTANNDLK
ncbi:MAG: murein biosynthesis integral membrane protein MurJ [Candidatus Gracilibacteria bacterium]|nr:murein biosynthesis integral membrane protein MurJ [Candidatus Gracilibacteria bacterium]